MPLTQFVSQSCFDFSVFKSTAECTADKTKTKLLHGFVKVVTSICQSCSMYFLPIAKKNKMKFDQVSKLVEASALN